MTKIVKPRNTALKKVAKPLLTIPEQEAYAVLQQWEKDHGGRIPTMVELVEAMRPVREIKVPRANELLKALEEKGYVRRRLEVCA